MVPKNGRSTGTTTPLATSAVLVLRSIGMIRVQTAGELLRQRAGIGTLAVVAEVERELDVENAHLEHVARHRAA